MDLETALKEDRKKYAACDRWNRASMDEGFERGFKAATEKAFYEYVDTKWTLDRNPRIILAWQRRHKMLLSENNLLSFDEYAEGYSDAISN